MRKDIQINVNTETSNATRDSETLGIEQENLQGKIIFKPYPFVDGACNMHVEGFKEPLEMTKEDDCYTIEITRGLLVPPGIFVSFSITEPENTSGIPVFHSKKIYFKVDDFIKQGEEEPEEFPTWQDRFNSKIAEINQLEENVEHAETDRENAELERDRRVDSAIENIIDLTDEYNQNAEEKIAEYDQNAVNRTAEYDNNTTEKTNEFNNNVSEKRQEINETAYERKSELNYIADGIKDMTTAIQFANFEIDENMNLIINTAEKLKNTNFILDEETGELEVEING